MKVPMKWLKEYVDIKHVRPKNTPRQMIMTGTAVGGLWTHTGEQFDNVVVGKVHYLRLIIPTPTICTSAMVDVGGEEPLQIVCGAPNVHAGNAAWRRRWTARTCRAA